MGDSINHRRSSINVKPPPLVAIGVARAGILQATQPLGCQYKELAQKDMVEDVDDEDEEVFEPPEKVIVCGNNFSRHFDLEAIPIIYLGTS